MYPRISDDIVLRIKHLPKAARGMPRYLESAYILVSELLDVDPQGEDNADFFNAIRTPEGTFDFKNTTRITQMAEVLLLLSNQPGFDEVIRRLRGRDLRSAFHEAQTTMTLIRAGFSIEARPERLVKTEDFDFSAVLPDLTLNVEVTGLTSAEYSEQNLRNAMKKKTRQLPTDRPGMIVAYYPRNWFGPKFEEDYYALTPAVERILGGTQRVNVIMMVSEQTIADPRLRNTGFRHLVNYKWFNKQPRHPFDNLLISRSHPPKLIVADGQESSAWKRWNGAAGQVRSEFFEWVDILLSRTALRLRT